ncbi:DNA-binding protein, partial [Shigella flexneri]
KVLACYQREANKKIARLLNNHQKLNNIQELNDSQELNNSQKLNNSQELNNSQVSCKGSVDSTITDLLEKAL